MMKKLIYLIGLCLLVCGPARAQSWSNILSPSRAIDWTQAGLPAVLTDGETTANPWTPPTGRTQCGSTLTPSGNPTTDTNAIQSAFNACTAGHFVLLGPGTFQINSYILFANNNVTLRGSGPMSTTLSLSGGYVFLNVGSGSGGSTCTWSSGFSAGSTTLGLTSCTGLMYVNTVLYLNQCDNGFSGSGCGTGSSVDNGGIYVCGVAPCIRAGEGAGGSGNQGQNVVVTSVASLGGGSYNVTVSPGIYLPNWSSGNTPTATFQATYTGEGFEDLTVYTDSSLDTGQTAVMYFNQSYGSWIKGVRFIGAAQTTDVIMSNLKNCLFMNNYLHSRLELDADYPVATQENSDSDTLILNNIGDSSVFYEGVGHNEGVVYAYNYPIWVFTNQETTNTMEHVPGNAFRLYEGNISNAFVEDDTHGTHDLSTWFRNYASGYYTPYTTNPNREVFNIDSGNRFTNFVGNVLGSYLTTTYTWSNYGAGDTFDFVYEFAANGSVEYDPLVQASSLRWGNYDTVTGATRWCGPGAAGFTSAPCNGTVTTGLAASESSSTITVTSTLNPVVNTPILLTACSVSGFDGMYQVQTSSGSAFSFLSSVSGLGSATGCTATVGAEVPTILPGNASALNNSVPSNTNLPCSFFLQGYTATSCTPHPSGGTGLNWWKVCTSWATFPTSCAATQTTPFPPIGPDVSGGSAPDASFGATPSIGGHAYDIPASIAYAKLPIDTTYQVPYTITASSWSAGTETLTASITTNTTHLIGGFELSGAPSGCNPSGGELYITNSTANGSGVSTISYTLASNPGSCTGTILFPDVREFDERVYESDPAGATSPPAPAPQMFTIKLTEEKEYETYLAASLWPLLGGRVRPENGGIESASAAFAH